MSIRITEPVEHRGRKMGSVRPRPNARSRPLLHRVTSTLPVWPRATAVLCAVLWLVRPMPVDAAIAWKEPSQPSRLVFSLPADAGMHALVSVPMTNCPPDTAFAVYGQEDAALPFRVVMKDDRAAILLVAVGVASMPVQPFAIYFGRRGTNRMETAALADPLPICASLLASSALGIPSTWDRMLYMAGQPAPLPITFRQHMFGEFAAPEARENHEGNRPRGPSPIVKARTWFVCEKAGPYRFAISCRDAGFVAVDGKLAVERPGEGDAGPWHIGSPVTLHRGPHLLEVFSKAKGAPLVSVGWQTPGQMTDPTPIPFAALVTSSMATHTRLERQDDPIHPDFTFTVGGSYAFRDGDATFTPVDFLSCSTSYGQGVSAPSWSFGDGGVAEGYAVRHIYRSSQPFAVAMRVRSADGRVTGSEGVVDCRYSEPRMIAVSAQIAGVPSALYAEDPVEPFLRIVSPAAGALPATLKWTMENSLGEPAADSSTINLAAATVTVPLPAHTAGAMTRLSWALLHCETPILSGAARFLRPPFSDLPTGALGASLLAANGDSLTLVPHRHTGDFTQRAITAADLAKGVLCIDDTLAAATGTAMPDSAYPHLLSRFLADKGLRVQVGHRRLQDWCEAPSAYGPLLTVVDVVKAAAEDAGVVVISVGRQGVMWHTDPAEFERLLAAAVDAVSATLGRPVVLVTPPAYATLGTAVRPYAAAVINVAVARGIPAADVFSSCMGTGADRPALFSRNSDLALSGAGQRLAARRVADALCRAQERRR